MRPSEFLATTLKNDSKKYKKLYIRRNKLFIYDPEEKSERKHFGVVWFYKSKTNQKGKKEFATLHCRCDLDLVCPVVELARLLKVMKSKNPKSAIFRWANRDHVTKYRANEILKNVAFNVGLDVEKISNYSWKKACITESIKRGLPDTVIVQLARWKSFHSIRPYINLEPRQLVEARQEVNRPSDNIVNLNRFRLFSIKP